VFCVLCVLLCVLYTFCFVVFCALFVWLCVLYTFCVVVFCVLCVLLCVLYTFCFVVLCTLSLLLFVFVHFLFVVCFLHVLFWCTIYNIFLISTKNDTNKINKTTNKAPEHAQPLNLYWITIQSALTSLHKHKVLKLTRR